MRLHDVPFLSRQPIDGYGPGFFRIAGEVMRGPVALLPAGVSAWSGFADVDGLLAQAGSIDVLLVGTGTEVAHVPPAFRSLLEDAGVGVEQMATPAACRTYNVLLGEGRRIGAALLPVG